MLIYFQIKEKDTIFPNLMEKTIYFLIKNKYL